MSAYHDPVEDADEDGDSEASDVRWRDDDCCGECQSWLRLKDNNNRSDTDSMTKRFVTVGSVRYGVRLGAVSPPPPGVGRPRYRAQQCCWPSPTPARIPPPTTPTAKNSRDARDIFGTAPPPVRGQQQLRRRGPLYERLLCDGECEPELDRLPRFRFGGNRDHRRSDKELFLRELMDRRRKTPVVASGPPTPPIPPPRNRHTPRSPEPTPSVEGHPLRTMPLRSASFSEVDYSTADNKYVMTKPRLDEEAPPTEPTPMASNLLATLPRVKKCTKNDYEPVLKPSVTIVEQECKRNSDSSSSQTDQTLQEKKRDKSRRRKGIYLDQWPNEVLPISDLLPNFTKDNNTPSSSLAPPSTNTPPCWSTSEIPKVQISAEIDCPDVWTSLDPPAITEETTQAQPTPGDTEWSRPPLSTQTSEEKDTLRIFKPPQLLRTDSLSEGEPEDRRSEIIPSDVSDCESRTSVGNESPGSGPHTPRRYSKRPLRGPYGQMLEAEMKKPDRKNQCPDLKFLEDLSPPPGGGASGLGGVALSASSSMGAADNKSRSNRRCNNHSLDDSQLKHQLSPSPSHSPSPSPSPSVYVVKCHPLKRKASVDSSSAPTDQQDGSGSNSNGNKLVVSHQRTTSSPSKLEGFQPPEASDELLQQLLRGSSEQLALNDTRTHVVIELYDTERHYVESLQILVTKYLEPLKSPENAGLLDAALVDEIFYQIPALHGHHNTFLDDLKKRLDHWDVQQKVGDVLLSMYSNPVATELYTNYVNNWNRAREIYKTAQQSKPAFAKFLEASAKEHKGKLALGELLIKPVQIFPKYELLIRRLITHTKTSHPDYNLLLSAQRELHEQILKINCTEREALDLDQLREIEGLVEGLMELVAADRQYLRHDSVHMKAPGGGLKERALFLFSDLLLITSIKRRSGTTRKPVTISGVPGSQGSVASTLEANKYKLLMKISLEELEIVRAKDENFRQMMLEIEKLTEDIGTLNQIQDLVWSLHRGHGQLDEIVREMLGNMSKQLNEQQNSDSQLCCLDLSVTTSAELVSLVFAKPDKRASWEESFNEAKHKLAMSGDRRPHPELLATVPIRKTRAGLQFTCAAPTQGEHGRDVWVCNSDGYVGQVCVLSLQPEPNVISCNGVCNARILCIASVPGLKTDHQDLNDEVTSKDPPQKEPQIQFDSSSSSEYDERSDEESVDPLGSKRELLSTQATPTAGGQVKSVGCTQEVGDSEEADTSASTMWLGTEDGCIHVYNSSDNIRIKKNKIRLQHGSAILCIIYLENRVFISLANGDLIIYERDSSSGAWNTNAPITMPIGSTQQPVSKMLPNSGKLWCACGNSIKVLNVETLAVEHTFAAHGDAYKPIACLVVAGNGVWLSLQNAAMIKCYHAATFDLLCEVNVAPAVTKMLTSCDDIIRQHKAACLRVTSLLACKELLWIGTSAGVLLTMPLPHIAASATRLTSVPSVMGVPHGHTGHVRFLSHVEMSTEAAGVVPLPNQSQASIAPTSSQRHSAHKTKSERAHAHNHAKLLVISGGDGYEDFRNSNLSEVAGREDSTNHLLLWNI
ncbi:rho guanine nucleotide exchange factor 17 isoform X2 [Atheta coriaria]|uniref:rho guanine nucleotide exchange factor 17 isoform X2 n=1 Tax=Dalotia coriaria TaxID=877792 RepID=UPI0031F36AFF